MTDRLDPGLKALRFEIWGFFSPEDNQNGASSCSMARNEAGMLAND